MNDEAKFLALLHAAKRVDCGHFLMRCPAHRGGFASSLDVWFEAGRLHMHCICGCSEQRVMDAVRRVLDDEEQPKEVA